MQARQVFREGLSARKIMGVTGETLLRGGTSLALGFTLGSARLFSGFSPFGVAFAAAAPAGAEGFLASLGAAVGLALGRDTLGSVRYLAVVLLIRTVLRVLRDTVLGETILLPMGTSLAALLTVGAVYCADGGWAPVPTALTAVEAFTAAGCVYFYSASLGGPVRIESRLGRTVSGLMLLASVLMALARPHLLGVFSPGRALAVFAVLTALTRGGAGAGLTAAAALGASMDLAGGTAGVFLVSYTLAALIAAVFARSGRLLCLLSFSAALVLGLIWTWPQYGRPDPLFETLAASVAFLLLPEAVMARLGGLFPLRETGAGLLRARQYAGERVEDTARAVRLLAESLRGLVPDEAAREDPARLFDRAADAVCRTCPRQTVCWQTGAGETYDIFNNLTPRLLRDGAIREEDLPERFRRSCERVRWLTAEVNAAARTQRLRLQLERRLGAGREAMALQFKDLSALLSTVSRDMLGAVSAQPALEKRLLRVLRGAGVETAVSVLRLGTGRLRVELTPADPGALSREKGLPAMVSEALGRELMAAAAPDGEGRLVLTEAPPLSARLGTAAARKPGSPVSGDRYETLLTDEGLLYLILSDGMGTGEEAARLAGAVTGSLAGFLRAGVEPELALRFLEDALFITNEAGAATATVDLVRLDLFTGDARLYKYGAAPTYLTRAGVVRRVTGTPFPAGLARRGKRGGATHLRLLSGTTVLLVTDGVLSGREDGWLRALLSSSEGDPGILAQRVLDTARETFSPEDDATVLVLEVAARKAAEACISGEKADTI